MKWSFRVAFVKETRLVNIQEVLPAEQEICKAQIYIGNACWCLFSGTGKLRKMEGGKVFAINLEHADDSWWDQSIFKVLSVRKIHSFRLTVEPIHCVSILLSLILFFFDLFLMFLNKKKKSKCELLLGKCSKSKEKFHFLEPCIHLSVVINEIQQHSRTYIHYLSLTFMSDLFILGWKCECRSDFQ